MRVILEDTTVDGLPVKYYSHQGGKIMNKMSEERIVFSILMLLRVAILTFLVALLDGKLRF